MKPRKITHNDLINKEVERNTPPIFLDKIAQEDTPQEEYKLSYYALKLIRRLLAIADADYNEVSISDRDLLEEALAGTSIKELARHKKCSQERIRQRVSASLDFLDQKISNWEHSDKQIKKLSNKVKRLEASAKYRDQMSEELAVKLGSLSSDNGQLKSILNEYLESQKIDFSDITPVDDQMRKTLKCNMVQIGIPLSISKRLSVHGIYSTIDLVRHTEQQLSVLDGITPFAVDLIKSTVKSLGLRLGIDIRWVSSVDDYFIFPSKQEEQ